MTLPLSSNVPTSEVVVIKFSSSPIQTNPAVKVLKPRVGAQGVEGQGFVVVSLAEWADRTITE